LPRDPDGDAEQSLEPPTATFASDPDAAAAALAEAHYADPEGVDRIWGRLRWHMLGPAEQARWRQVAHTGDRKILLAVLAPIFIETPPDKLDSPTCRQCRRAGRRWRLPEQTQWNCGHCHPPVNPGVEWQHDQPG
jgi:hypothetical protein